MSRQILVTSALPYVNGHIHIGHLVEYIQTDIWVRFQRLRGNRVVYLCADDTHGTATMIRARQEGRSEQAIIEEMSAAHQKDFAEFGVRFDHYGSTDSRSNKKLVAEIWTALRAAKDDHGAAIVAERDVTQLYDPKAGSFLADRFVKGTCPKCKSPDQYGDSCDKCASTFSPTDLIDPVSTLSGAKPELRSAKHYFVRLEPFREFLKQWTRSGSLQPEMANWLHGTFLNDELRDWDVSRPAPYFGFEIPDAPGNYFYVWVDAPVGYLASLADWCAKKPSAGSPASWWPRAGEAGYQDDAVEIHHFIGKDITYFHTLFWPAMLRAAGYKLPTKVHIHGFLTVNGEKMSKSKGTFIRGRTYLETIGDPAYLRYYYASKLSDQVQDLDLNLEEFVAKVNSDLVGKVVNLASRTAKFVEGIPLPALDNDAARTRFWQNIRGRSGLSEEVVKRIADAYEFGDFSSAVRLIMACADKANQFVESAAPWSLAKDPARRADLLEYCSIALHIFWKLSVYLSPILPNLANAVGILFDRPIREWNDADAVFAGKPLRPFKHLLSRLESAKVQAMVSASAAETAAKETAMITPNPPAVGSVAPAAGAPADAGVAFAGEPLAPTIVYEDFAKLDLRVARINAADEVPGAKKILKLTLGLGGTETRVVYAGIKAAYPQPATLVGRLIVVVANLAPKQMSFGISEGMALAAGPGGSEVFLLAPDSGAKPGQRVH